MKALAAVWSVVRSALVALGVVALLLGEWRAAGAALVLLVAPRLAGVPPTHLREVLASQSGHGVRRVVLTRLLGEVLPAAHTSGVPAQAVGVLLVRLGEDLQHGRAPELLAELQQDTSDTGSGHGG